MSIHILTTPSSNWGDYGDILISGMSGHLERKDGLIQLERTGPFIPPITLPGIGDIVVTDAFRRKIESSGLTGMTFLPVLKAHIVHLEWEKWDQSAEEAQEYPDEGEPEGYVLERSHSPEIAEAMGDLWEVCPRECVDVQREKIGPNSWNVQIQVVLSSWAGTDWFRGKGYRYNYVSDKTKAWLEKNAGEWVSFKPAPLAQSQDVNATIFES